MSEIVFDEWRQDIVWPDGTTSKDVRFVRATKGDLQYHCPIFTKDDEVDESINLVEDAKELLKRRIERT